MPEVAELSYDQVVEILGPMSDVIVAEIIATGITKDELSAARNPGRFNRGPGHRF
jgi:hypothetical protein